MAFTLTWVYKLYTILAKLSLWLCGLQALLSCEGLLHPRSLPPVQPAGGAVTDADGARVSLGMPRFWTHVDVDAGAINVAQQMMETDVVAGEAAAEPTNAQQVQLAQTIAQSLLPKRTEAPTGTEQERSKPNGVAAGDVPQATEEQRAAGDSEAECIKRVRVQAQAARAANSAALAAVPPPAARIHEDKKVAEPEAARQDVQGVARPAAGDDSDSDISLPDIDSGESSDEDE